MVCHSHEKGVERRDICILINRMSRVSETIQTPACRYRRSSHSNNNKGVGLGKTKECETDWTHTSREECQKR